MRFFIGIIFCFLILSRSFASTEVYSLAEITMELSQQPHPKKIWMLWDIDETLLLPGNGFGNEAWYEFYIHYFQRLGCTKDEACNKAHELWDADYYKVNYQLMEASLPDDIRKIQQAGIVSFALTARNLSMSAWTLKHLYDVGIFFGNKIQHPLFRAGVIYAGARPKGEVLQEILSYIPSPPEEIWLADDKIRHLENVEKILRQMNIKFRGFHFKGAFCASRLQQLH